MPTQPPLPTPRVRSEIRLVEASLREQSSDGVAATDVFNLESCEVDANPALLEQAKGALMLRFGIDSHQAFAMLLSWGRMSREPVHTIAHTLMRGICEGNPHTEVRQGPLMRLLEAQLRIDDPDHARLRTAKSRPEPAHESPRPD